MMHYRIIIFFFEYHHGREWSEKIEFRQVKNHHQRGFYVLCIALYYGQNNLSITEPLKFILIGNYKSMWRFVYKHFNKKGLTKTSSNMLS